MKMKVKTLLNTFLILSFALMSTHSYSLEKLKFLSSQQFPTGFRFKDSEVGGLSSLYFRESDQSYFAISDDRGQNGLPRVYQLKIAVQNSQLKVDFIDVIHLKNLSSQAFETDHIDPEGIVLLKDNMWISSEGDTRKKSDIKGPELLQFNLGGQLLRSINLPEHYQFNILQKMGPRNNMSIESLSLTPDLSQLVIGFENALFQDGDLNNALKSSLVRFLKVSMSSELNQITQNQITEYFYRLPPIPAPNFDPKKYHDYAISDMLMIDSNSAYMIERGFIGSEMRYKIKIVTASGFDQIKPKSNENNLLSREEILNLEDIISTLPAELNRLENYEGIAFGPKLENGHQTLILCSDNNFHPLQRTSFLFFEIIP